MPPQKGTTACGSSKALVMLHLQLRYLWNVNIQEGLALKDEDGTVLTYHGKEVGMVDGGVPIVINGLAVE